MCVMYNDVFRYVDTTPEKLIVNLLSCVLIKNKFTTQMYPITKKGFILTFCYNITCEVKCVLKEEISF